MGEETFLQLTTHSVQSFSEKESIFFLALSLSHLVLSFPFYDENKVCVYIRSFLCFSRVSEASRNKSIDQVWSRIVCACEEDTRQREERRVEERGREREKERSSNKLSYQWPSVGGEYRVVPGVCMLEVTRHRGTEWERSKSTRVHEICPFTFTFCYLMNRNLLVSDGLDDPSDDLIKIKKLSTSIHIRMCAFTSH